MTDEINGSNYKDIIQPLIDGLNECESFSEFETLFDTVGISSAILPFLGFGLNHGLSPSEKRPKGADPNLDFKPDYLTAIYIKFQTRPNEPSIIVRHGYADITNVTREEKRQKIAEKLLINAKRSARWARRNNAEDKKWRREDDFRRLTFDSQNKIYILVDNDNVEFDDRENSSGEQDNLVRFTKFVSESDLPTISNKVAEKNNAFLNAKLVEVVRRKSFNSAYLLTIENWYTDKEGKTIDIPSGKPGLLYAMNIHLLMETSDGTQIPVILDPDTGNGWGHNP